MNANEALQLALGYAWGCEDSTDVKTATDSDVAVGTSQFADAYAKAQDEYDNEQRGHMVPVQVAYKNWQESRGSRIFDTYTDSLTSAERRVYLGRNRG
jgi:hypothetical protein